MTAKLHGLPGEAVISITVVSPPAKGNVPVHRSVGASRLPQPRVHGLAHDSSRYDPPGNEIAVGSPSLSRRCVSTAGPVIRRYRADPSR